VNPRRLIGVSRFLARQYYRERVVRLFRYIRLLTPWTGRDPCSVLQGPAILPVLDRTVLGTPESAARILTQIDLYLTDRDDEIRIRLPFWRDLIRYQSALFRIEAEGAPLSGSAPLRRAASSQILDFDWDLPRLLQQIRDRGHSWREGMEPPMARWVPSTVLVACGRYGRIATLRCDRAIRSILEAADGRRDRDELARIAGIPVDRAGMLLQQLQEVGALS
jgi:hypothetical protein